MELQNIALQINDHHNQAHRKAVAAVEHAKAAGELLLGVKASLPHGEFNKWIKHNLTVSERQAQRYIAVAKGKAIPIRRLAAKTDTRVSFLKAEPKSSSGIWKNARWLPEQGFLYLFKEENSSYWVHPAKNGGFHVCKHYSGQRMSSTNFFWRYTVFGVNKDPEVTSDFYVGTRIAPLNIGSVHEILTSYGLKDANSSLVFGLEDKNPSERPFCEPLPDSWYWDGAEPEDDLYRYAKSIGLVNQQGSVGYF